MTALRIISRPSTSSGISSEHRFPSLFSRDGLCVEGEGLFFQWRNDVGDHFFLLGDVIGVRGADGMLSSPPMVRLDPKPLEDPNFISKVEGRFLLVKIETSGACEVWADQFGKIDVYWQSVEGYIVLGTSLDLLPLSRTGSPPDNVGVAHALTVYGARPAKKHTLYQGVHRLGVNQGIRLSKGSYNLLSRPFKAAHAEPYGDRDLHRYSDLFLEAIRARASSDGNVVYLSSGWDSTSILACLVHLFGTRKVRAVIGRMQYSSRSGVCNQFEIDRARAMADYFGVRLDIVELDYRSQAEELLDRVKSLFQAQQFASFTGFNHWLLAEGTAKTAEGKEMIFTGEVSDGAHNLGFSQFVSIFHPSSMAFREYSDKMASYLFGPTFLEQLIQGSHELDPIWQIFRQRNAGTILDPAAKGKHAIIRQLLASFFLRSGRFPLYSSDNTPLLTKQGREQFAEESEHVYLEEVCDQVTTDNLYAWYLHLYNSFHWQGATVATLDHTAGAHGLRCVSPFHDSALIDFLSAMPEDWGRGLDFNPTKYPLKWMLRNRIDYPNHLQVGPHSYIYDVRPDFSLVGELLHASSFTSVFHKTLRTGRFIDWLDANFFDRSYVDTLRVRYLQGEELRGQEMRDLCVLALHSAIGVYGPRSSQD
jgi:asparagine synthetase B (glutamine-hydrolysing)